MLLASNISKDSTIQGGTNAAIMMKHKAVLDSADDLSRGLMEGQINRLELMKRGIDPILPGPEQEDLEGLIKRLGSSSTNEALAKYLEEIGEWKYTLFARLDNIRLNCGLLCQLNSAEMIEKYTDHEQKVDILSPIIIPDVNCETILGLEDIDAGDMTFPATIPEELQDFYSLGGQLHFRWDRIFKDAYLGGASEKGLWKTGNVWNEDDINEAVKKVNEGIFRGTYGIEEVNTVRESLKAADMNNKSVLVIGSQQPWIELICLSLGAKKVTTLEYGEIISNHPQIKTETPSTIRKKFLEGTLEKFDGIVTHSSIEHSGLGRYGDALNPWGDILAVQRAWCMANSKAFMWIGVPTGSDMVFYNWHRVYGRVRWPLLAINWRQTGRDVKWPSKGDLFDLDPFKSMQNTGFLFEKIEATN